MSACAGTYFSVLNQLKLVVLLDPRAWDAIASFQWQLQWSAQPAFSSRKVGSSAGLCLTPEHFAPELRALQQAHSIPVKPHLTPRVSIMR